MHRHRTPVWAPLGLVMLFAVVAVPAQGQTRGGIQGGASLDPDQVYVGAHVLTSPLVDNLRFRPNVDVGIGNDLTLIAFNLDFTYAFPSGRPWSLYVGAGPAINYYNVDGGDSEAEGGFNILFGARHVEGLFFEFKVGMEGSPDLKFGVGYTFR